MRRFWSRDTISVFTGFFGAHRRLSASVEMI
jgi:hypothetical protein